MLTWTGNSLLSTRTKYILATLGILLAVALYVYRLPAAAFLARFFDLLNDREKTQAFISGFGQAAPLAFILIQILQVLLAPFPGEATGFIGGYLFGSLPGFVFSSIGLSIGSVLNFLLGRFLGRRYVRRMLAPDRLRRFDRLLKRQGVLVVFVLFVFPGFPKDYLCLFLGVSALPFKVFILLATIGRMPGTLMLSLQGAAVFERNYLAFAAILAGMGGMTLIGWRYKEKLYAWVEKFNNRAAR